MGPTPPHPETKQNEKTRNKSHQELPIQVGSSIRRKAERRGRLYYNCPIIRGRRTAADKSINHQLDRGLQLSRLLFFVDLLLSSRLTIHLTRAPCNYRIDSLCSQMDRRKDKSGGSWEQHRLGSSHSCSNRRERERGQQ